MWVLFRDEHGKAACVHDECAHRACPLSLGSVEAGRVQCAYHGACLLSLFPSFASPFVGALETATNGRWLAASKPPGQTLRMCRHADGRSVQDHAPRSGILGATASSPAPPMCRPAGWQFNSRGECTKMPSTAFCKVLTRAASQPAGMQTSHRCCCPRGVAHSGGAWNGACRRTPPHCSSFSPAPCSRSAVSAVFPFCSPPCCSLAGHQGQVAAGGRGRWTGLGVAGVGGGARSSWPAALHAHGAALWLPGGPPACPTSRLVSHILTKDVHASCSCQPQFTLGLAVSPPAVKVEQHPAAGAACRLHRIALLAGAVGHAFHAALLPWCCAGPRRAGPGGACGAWPAAGEPAGPGARPLHPHHHLCQGLARARCARPAAPPTRFPIQRLRLQLRGAKCARLRLGALLVDCCELSLAVCRVAAPPETARPKQSAAAPCPCVQMWCASTQPRSWAATGSPTQSTCSSARPAWCSAR